MDGGSGMEVLCKLGEGAYGLVHKVRVKESGELLAVKVISVCDEDEGVHSTSLREISILKSVDHPNIVKLKSYRLLLTEQSPRIELYFEYIEEDLSRMIRRDKLINPSNTKLIMRQLIEAIAYMHGKNIIHRDLKPQNILISKTNIVKIADFGLGRITGQILRSMSKQIQTLWYRAPELLLGNQRYNYAVDLWALGCIFYELAEGRILFQTESEIGQIFEIMYQQGTPRIEEWPQLKQYYDFKVKFPKFKGIHRTYNNLSESGIDLLDRMLVLNPKKRITIEEARKHRYLLEL